MKALFFTNEYPPNVYGGAGVHVDYLSRELAKLIDVEVHCFVSNGFQEQITESSLKVRRFGVDVSKYECPSHLQGVFAAMQRCLDWNSFGVTADLVHLHTWYTHLGGIIAKLAYGVPLVVTVHSLEPLRPWKREQIKGGYDFSCWVEKTALEMADAVVAVSRDTKVDILNCFNLPESKVHVIHNGINLDEYRNHPCDEVLLRYDIDPRQPYILFVGRVTRQKGILHLVRAIRYMRRDFQIVICAGAPDTPQLAMEIRELVSCAQEHHGRVIWIDQMVEKVDLISIYSGAGVFCCPSVYEPFGIINLEAMACGVPVVASGVGGIREVVVHEETGFLVPLSLKPGTFEPVDEEIFERDFANRVNELMGDAQMRARMGAAGRHRVESSFSWSSIARRTHSLYEELLENPRR